MDGIRHQGAAGVHLRVFDARDAWRGREPVPVGTNLAPGDAGELVAAYDDVRRWFDAEAGLPTWSNERPLHVVRNDPAWLGGLAAGIDAGIPTVREGSWDSDIRAEGLGRLLSFQRPRIEAQLAAVDRGREALRGHEVTHLATGLAWGEPVERLAGAAPEARYLDRVVDEAVADLFGAARVASADLGVRVLGAPIRADVGFEDLRASVRDGAPAMNAYEATRWLTTPMHGVAREHGWQAVTRATADAVRDLAGGVIDPAVAAQSLEARLPGHVGGVSASSAAARDVWHAVGLLR